MNQNDYQSINKNTWNEKTHVHYDSEFYDVKGFLAGNSSLNDFELALLGDVQGKKILHLQCHFGQDSISLARMGAHVTGLDISDAAIEKARNLAESAGEKVNFVCTDTYNAANVIHDTFDIIFMSYGVIGWLPDMDKLASVVNQLLAPGGKYILVEFHPAIWMYDDDFTHIKYSYFNREPIIELAEGTYAEKEADMSTTTITWNHSIGEVVTSFLQQGLKLSSLQEYDYSPYDCFMHNENIGPKQFIIPQFGQKFPMVYSVVFEK